MEVLDAIHKVSLNTSPVNCLEYVLDLSIAVGKVAERTVHLCVLQQDHILYICMFIHTKGNAMCASMYIRGLRLTYQCVCLCKKKRAVTRREQRTPIPLYYANSTSADDDDTLTSITSTLAQNSNTNFDIGVH